MHKTQCECRDPLCPAHPNTLDECTRDATHYLFRIDMPDHNGTAFCTPCGDDAMSSGLHSPLAQQQGA